MSRLHLGGLVRRSATLAFCGMAALAGTAPASVLAATSSLPAPVPAIADYQLLATGTTPPSESACLAIGRRCFTATAMENSYNLPALYAAGDEGQGETDLGERFDVAVDGEDGEAGEFRLEAGRGVENEDLLVTFEVEFLEDGSHGFR